MRFGHYFKEEEPEVPEEIEVDGTELDTEQLSSTEIAPIIRTVIKLVDEEDPENHHLKDEIKNELRNLRQGNLDTMRLWASEHADDGESFEHLAYGELDRGNRPWYFIYKALDLLFKPAMSMKREGYKFKKFMSADEAYVNNNPFEGEPYKLRDPEESEYDEIVDLDTELKIGIKEEEESHIFLDIINVDAYSGESNVVGYMSLRANNSVPYPIAKFIKINPAYQGQGYGKTIYEWIINRFGGLVSDESLSKRGGKGSFHVWKSLEQDGYNMSVIKWADVEDWNSWEPKKIKSIDGWVKHGKGGYRLVVSGE